MSKTESRKLSDDYEVVDVLGRGGFSIVRRGVSKSEEKTQVAIKTLRRLGPAMAGMKQGTKPVPGSGLPMWKQVSISDALLTNEILVMRRIVESVAPHPNVINLHDVYEDVHGVHLVLELCSGGELFDRIVGRDRYSEFDAACVIRQIASGLEALHKASIVHRDLKPENCLFSDKDEKSTLKIMDFGLSSVEDFSDPIVALFGSIDYVSPEALSRQEVSAASDMWSVGVILYILLSGYVGHFLVIVPLIRIIFVVLSLVVCVFQMPTISCCNQSRKAAKDPASKFPELTLVKLLLQWCSKWFGIFWFAFDDTY